MRVADEDKDKGVATPPLYVCRLSCTRDRYSDNQLTVTLDNDRLADCRKSSTTPIRRRMAEPFATACRGTTEGLHITHAALPNPQPMISPLRTINP